VLAWLAPTPQADQLSLAVPHSVLVPYKEHCKHVLKISMVTMMGRSVC
jgi:hypothetical protein